jgi:hypothetical protein
VLSYGSLILLLFLCRTTACGADAADAPEAEADAEAGPEDSARGFAQEPRAAFLPSAFDWLGRFAVDTANGLAFHSADGLTSKDDPRTIKRPEDAVPLERRWGAVPKISFRTGTAQVGANVFFREGRVGVVGGAVLGSTTNYDTSAAVSWQKPLDSERTVRVSLEALHLSDTKHRFYGIGSAPRADPRSAYLATAESEYGRYRHLSDRVALMLGLRSSPHLDLFVSSQYLRQRAETIPDDPFSIEKVFDLTRLAGAQAPSRQFYNEAAFTWDTRRYRGSLSGGFSLAGYTGVSLGVGGDESRSLRTGGDAALYLPLWHGDRLLVPRITLDTLTNLNDAVPFSFMTYPRQLPFRGVNSAITLLRQDDVVVNTSMEYQWPLSAALTAALFTQGVLVGRTVDTVTTRRAPWNAGARIELHTPHAPVFTGWITTGSEGLYIWFQMGVIEKGNDRWRWY